MTRRSWLPWLDDRDRDLMEEADAEYAMNDAEFQRWILRQWDGIEGYDADLDDPNAFDPRDPDDRLESEGGRLGG